MKMKNEEKIVALALVGTLIGIVFIGWIIGELIAIGNNGRTTNAQRYDMNCLTQPIEKPLTECKENK